MPNRGEERRGRARVALLFVLAAGCGDGLQRDDAVTDCDPVDDTGCPAGEHCRVVGDGTLRCLPAAATSEDVSLQSTGPSACRADSCPPGQACVVVEGVRGCHPVCRRRVEGPCPCNYGIAGSERWGVCPTPCTFGEGSCPADATCAPTQYVPYLVCVAVGPAEVGAPCSQPCNPDACARGLACLQRVGEAPDAGVADDSCAAPDDGSAAGWCARLCTPGAADDCPAPERCTGVIDGQPEVGYCVAP